MHHEQARPGRAAADAADAEIAAALTALVAGVLAIGMKVANFHEFHRMQDPLQGANDDVAAWVPRTLTIRGR